MSETVKSRPETAFDRFHQLNAEKRPVSATRNSRKQQKTAENVFRAVQKTPLLEHD